MATFSSGLTDAIAGAPTSSKQPAHNTRIESQTSGLEFSYSPTTGGTGARATIGTFLNQYGLGSLTNWALDVYTRSGGGATGMAAISAELPNTVQFQHRFPAYQQLASEGRAMSVDQMLHYETMARQIFHAAGIPEGFYDSPDDFAGFMLHDVSVSELESRVQTEQQAMISSPQDVRDTLHRYYGVDQGHLTAFFLDPDKALPIIQQKFTAAQIGAEASRTGFGNINQTQALGLAQQGVTDAQAAAGFNKLGTEAGLFQAQVTGEQTIGTDTQLAAQFGNNAPAQLAFEQRAARRKAAFAEDAGFGISQAGVTGLAPAQKGA